MHILIMIEHKGQYGEVLYEDLFSIHANYQKVIGSIGYGLKYTNKT